jgi:uroporphyrinogen decarboxylase
MIMNHRERFVRTLTGKEVDRVPFIKVFGGTNAVQPRWEKECPGLSERIDEILQFEGGYRGWGIPSVNVHLSQRGKPVVVEETESRRVQRYAEGAVEIILKGADYHHQTVEWPVKSRKDWERVKAKQDYPLQLTHGGVYGFARRYLMGDERLMYAFYDDPDLVHDMMDIYTDMVLSVWSRMVKDLEFDLIECWEDMASKNGSLISPHTFRAFMTPNYRKIAAFAKEHGIEVILVDSDGYIDNLAELMMEGGVTAMYPFEVGAGCDISEARKRYPTLSIIGGLAKEVMAYGKKEIEQEVERARRYIQWGRYIPGPDHFVLSNVSWANYRYFMERLREVVMTTKPQISRSSEGVQPS